MSQRVSTLPAGVPEVQFSFRKHILPPIAGAGVCLVVFGLLNLPILEARASYYMSQFNAPRPVAMNSVVVNPDLPQVIIPSIGVKAPVIYEANPNNAIIEYDLRSGVVHYGTSALPGERGNVVIFGHSSGMAWAPGNYKFIFTLLDKVKVGKQISVDYKGTRYVYEVESSEVVEPTDMKILSSHSSQAELSIVTCSPVGTSNNRLVVHAKQISPDPASDKPFRPGSAAATTNELPSN